MGGTEFTNKIGFPQKVTTAGEEQVVPTCNSLKQILSSKTVLVLLTTASASSNNNDARAFCTPYITLTIWQSFIGGPSISATCTYTKATFEIHMMQPSSTVQYTV